MRERTRELKAKALSVGARLVGIAPARPLPESRAYDEWIDKGMQGTMAYMAKNAESRRDITHWYPEAKSVILCGFSYFSPDQPNSKSDVGTGRFARYSVLPDYHPELKERMLTVLSWLKKTDPGADGRVFVDTSPLLERLYARYAGLGWIGKNTMLIHPGLGSYFFITGLALNREYEYDEPGPDHCGSCDRCLKACPTDAFPRERVLDASRCVAYFTIEHKGGIPEVFRPGLGNRVMGCDACQEACPWNRFSLPGIFPRIIKTEIPLEELAAVDQPGFKARFGKTPVSRAKRVGLLRNTLLAMGNSGDPRHRSSLERYCGDEDPILNKAASWSLSRLPSGSQLDKVADNQ